MEVVMNKRYKYTFENKDQSGGKYYYASYNDVDKVVLENEIDLEEMEIIHIEDTKLRITIFDPWKGIFSQCTS